MRVLLVPNIAAALASHTLKLREQYDEWATFNLIVVAYCEQHHIKCADLNTFVTATEPRDIFHALAPLFSELLVYLDKVNSNALNCFNDLPALTWYFSTFRYMGLHEYNGLMLFDTSLRRYLKARRVKQIDLIGNFDPGPCILTGNHYLTLAQEITEAANATFMRLALGRTHSGSTNTSVATSIRRSLLTWYRKARLALYLTINFARNLNRKKGAGTLIFEPLYEANFLPLAHQKVYYWPHHPTGLTWGLPIQEPGRLRSKTNLPVTPTIPIQSSNMKHAQFYSMAMTDFICSTIRQFDAALYRAMCLIKEQQINQALLPSPAVAAEPKALVVELLRRSGVQVFGLQHGGCYGDQDLGLEHLLSDYLHCDTFLGYKADAPDWSHVPDIELSPCKIVPVGSLKLWCRGARPAKESFKIRARILFPISTASDISTGSPLGKGEWVFRAQEAILERLDSQYYPVVVKPLRNYLLRADLLRSYPTQFAIGNLRHCKIDARISYEAALLRYRPGLVVLEWFSTTLYETLAFDCDIIQLIDPVCPPKVAVRTMLETRVHFADTVEQLLCLIEAFVGGNLPVLRNNEFYDQCVCPPGDAIQRACGHLGWI